MKKKEGRALHHHHVAFFFSCSCTPRPPADFHFYLPESVHQMMRHKSWIDRTYPWVSTMHPLCMHPLPPVLLCHPQPPPPGCSTLRESIIAAQHSRTAHAPLVHACPQESKRDVVFGRFSPYHRHLHPDDTSAYRLGAGRKEICTDTGDRWDGVGGSGRYVGEGW